MAGVFDGIRVLEVAEWTLVPAAGSILAQYGADVIKIERPVGGDAQRGLAVAGVTPVWNGIGLNTEQTNLGGKRSVGIDIASAEGQELVRRLAATSDVFLTNLLPATRKKFHLDVDDLRAVKPDIVYAYGHGVGTLGPDADKAGYDMTAYWCRSGLGYSVSEPGSEPVAMRPGMGDRFGAMNIAAGVAGALLRKECTGEGAVVEVSLLAAGIWQLASDVVYSKALGIENSRVSRGRNAMTGYYETADGRWITLSLLNSDRWAPEFLKAAEAEELTADPRFANAELREQNYEACKAEMTRIFKRFTLAEWRAKLACFGGPWEVVQSIQEVLDDPQVAANSYVTDVAGPAEGRLGFVPAPIRFDGQPGRTAPCPEAGAQTEDVLLDLGLSWEDIGALKEAGHIT
jgi:crotonobetainyl-CoA:carnitine CoA-transferase CaiB-like acyl-CoA transferase